MLLDEAFREAALAATTELVLASSDQFAAILAEAARLEMRTQAAANRARSRIGAIYQEAQSSMTATTSAAQAFAHAEARVAVALQDAWLAGEQASRLSMMTQLRYLRAETLLPDTVSSSYLASVLTDLRAISESAVAEVLLANGDAELIGSAVKAASRRASAAASVVPVRAASDMQIQAMLIAQDRYPNLSFVKVWVTSFSPTTCATCAALHGQVTEIDSEYSHDITFGISPKTVRGTLPGPPRHPNCHCRLVPYVEERLASSAMTPSTLRDQSAAYAVSKNNMSPRSFQTQDFSMTARTTNFLTSDDIKKIPQSKWDMLKDGFRACIVGFKRFRG